MRDDLLRAARAEAARILADAERDAGRSVAAAEEAARAIVADARTRGAAEGREAARDVLMLARRDARCALLTAERTAFHRLQEACVLAANELRRDPRYARWSQALRGTARRRLGNGARIEEDSRAGVLGHAPGLLVDLRLAGLAMHVLEKLGREVPALWTP